MDSSENFGSDSLGLLFFISEFYHSWALNIIHTKFTKKKVKKDINYARKTLFANVLYAHSILAMTHDSYHCSGNFETMGLKIFVEFGPEMAILRIRLKTVKEMTKILKKLKVNSLKHL